MINTSEMAIKFPCRKHLVNYIGCHITGTIYSSAQIRWITFALELKNIWYILILLKHKRIKYMDDILEAFLRDITVLGVNDSQVI